MSEKDSGLCKSCLCEFNNGDYPFTPWQHCHHEPKEKEKPKCWCEYSNRRVKLWNGDGYAPIVYCPECGRKL